MHGAKFFLCTVDHSGNSCGPGPSSRSLRFKAVILGTFGLNEVREDYFLKGRFPECGSWERRGWYCLEEDSEKGSLSQVGVMRPAHPSSLSCEVSVVI